jgi:hypothetical protein
VWLTWRARTQVHYPVAVELVEREGALAALASWLGEAGGRGGPIRAGFRVRRGSARRRWCGAFCDEHVDEARVWWGACDALSTPRPLGPLV